MSDQPRVCFVSPAAYGYFNPEAEVTGGGAERQFHLLATGLATDFDVHVVVGDYGQPVRERREGVTLHRAYRPERGSGTLVRVQKLRELYAALRRSDADVYLCRGFPHKAATVSLMCGVMRAAFVYHLSADDNLGRHYEALSPPWRLLFRRALRSADCVVAQTPFQEERLAAEFDVESTRIPNGYPAADSFVPYEDRDGFVWVGNINERNKRPHRYLDAAERLPDEAFTMVGPPDDDEAYVDRIRERAEELGNVEYVGAVAPDEVHAYLEAPYALVNTSPFEGFPNTFLEAWRYGTPVLSLAVDPGKYVDFPGETGGADGDFESFLSLLQRAASSPEFREALGRPAERQFAADYRIDGVLDAYEAMLRHVLS